jgi:hypothetical protein
MILRSFFLLLSAFVFSGCSMLDVFTIADTESSITDKGLGDEPPGLQWINQDMAVNFDLGSFCWSGSEVAMCVDKMAPEYIEEQHLPVDASMDLLFAAPIPNSASLSLYPGSNLSASESIPLETTLDEVGNISITLPDNLDGFYVLAVFATWEGGDAFYTLPIEIVR